MAKQSSGVAAEATEHAAVCDPLGALYTELTSPDENEVKVNARRTISGMAQRPWQQLPVKLRGAVRADVRRLREGKLSREDIIAKGYSFTAAEQALRDIGQGGA